MSIAWIRASRKRDVPGVSVTETPAGTLGGSSHLGNAHQPLSFCHPQGDKRKGPSMGIVGGLLFLTLGHALSG